MSEKQVCIQPLGKVSREVLEFIEENIRRVFKVDCVISDVKLEIPREAFNKFRKQYYSSYILRYLLELNELGRFKRVLGVTEEDLFVPHLNFVFGEALLNGRVAVISLHRLRPEFYGEERDDSLLLERAVKEAVHELGHTFGLNHCRNRRCVMSFSNSIYDTDRKGKNFCPLCLKRIETV